MDERDGEDGIRKADALISHYLHIPHPETLSDEVWCDKAGQAQWLHRQLHQSA
ncbi:hypothetical protein [Hymenobacter sp. CRA2]|uniref:hypothetical protein n=1 Tax=Hymenobacter sp. CRA2 TaxID=1955620 RepID=UPI0015918622|nr:hypothetical protein [Hymenobacter sp. CRA2]